MRPASYGDRYAPRSECDHVLLFLFRAATMLLPDSMYALTKFSLRLTFLCKAEMSEPSQDTTHPPTLILNCQCPALIDVLPATEACHDSRNYRLCPVPQNHCAEC